MKYILFSQTQYIVYHEEMEHNKKLNKKRTFFKAKICEKFLKTSISSVLTRVENIICLFGKDML